MPTDHFRGNLMQSEKTTGKAAGPGAPAHDAELSAEQVAERLAHLGDEAEKPKPEEHGDADTAEETAEGEPKAEAAEQSDEEPKGEAEEEAHGDAESAEPDAEAEAQIPKERLDREIEKRRKANERAEAADAEVAKLKAQLDDQALAVAERMALHPDFVSSEDRKLILRANELEQEKARLLEQWDGVENEDPKLNVPAVDVRRKYATVDSELQRIAPQADSAYRKAKAEMLEALRVGREVLRERKAAKPLSKPPSKPVPAQAPVKTTASNARPIGTPGQRKPDIMKIFRDKGSDAMAAEAALANL
jgi:hypothetical protein